MFVACCWYSVFMLMALISALKWLSNSLFYRCFSNQSCDRPHCLARALPVYICTWDHAHRGPLPRLMYPTCKHAAHLYQSTTRCRSVLVPVPSRVMLRKACQGRTDSNRGMHLVCPMGATRTACACAGIEYLAEAQRQSRSSGRGL